MVAVTWSQAANAAPTPAAPTTVYSENFENGVGNTPVLLTDYVSASGISYTADPSWLTGCNGDVLSSNTTSTGSTCSSSSDFTRLRQLALALGEHAGESPAAAADNHVVAAYTENNPGAGAHRVPDGRSDHASGKQHQRPLPDLQRRRGGSELLRLRTALSVLADQR